MQSIIVWVAGGIIVRIMIVIIMNFIYEVEFCGSVQYDDCCNEGTDGQKK